MTNFTEMNAKQLVNAYNEMAKELDTNLVIRFASRAAGIKRCEKIAAQMPAAEVIEVAEVIEAAEQGCPSCGAIDDQTAAGIEGTAADERNLCHHCSTEYWVDTRKVYKAPAASTTRSEAIAESWKNEATRAKRTQRHAVRVNGNEFKSVRAAFAALNLPMKTCIKFRMALKAAGKIEENGNTWEVIEA